MITPTQNLSKCARMWHKQNSISLQNKLDYLLTLRGNLFVEHVPQSLKTVLLCIHPRLSKYSFITRARMSLGLVSSNTNELWLVKPQLELRLTRLSQSCNIIELEGSCRPNLRRIILVCITIPLYSLIHP